MNTRGALILTTLRYANEVVNPGDMEELSKLKKTFRKRDGTGRKDH